MKISIYTVNDTPIGGGGMGNVYLGTDPQGNCVAIKRMHPQLTTDANMRAFFHKEISTHRQLDHPSIVKMYDSFEEGGILYLIMEYVEGETLDKYVKRHGGVLPETEAVIILSDILPALSYFHSLGYVHRDIKPNNIMIRPNGKTCLLDFGVVKDMKSSSNLTVGQKIGTDGYMSVEQALGYSINHLSDIYSLGCVLFFMLTGRTPFVKQTNDFDTRKTIIKQPFPKAQHFNPKVSDFIQSILDKATCKDMRLRFQSCCELELEICGGGTRVGPDTELDSRNTISVGRLNCDITVAPHNHRVSRHHLDITFVQNTDGGGSYYKISDRSANGTAVNGENIHNRTVETRYAASLLLAGEEALKWTDVKAAFAQKQGAAAKPATDTPTKKRSRLLQWLLGK
ncbi:MAG: protein kinase [Prevotellaceae bacterium]|jgi:serine/threonine-protein kinase|nr:protein kinase [Prevotellaceae bacterium]